MTHPECEYCYRHVKDQEELLRRSSAGSHSPPCLVGAAAAAARGRSGALLLDGSGGGVHGAPGPGARVSHGGALGLAAGAYTSPLFQLNISTFAGIRWVASSLTVAETAQVELNCGRVNSPTLQASRAAAYLTSACTGVMLPALTQRLTHIHFSAQRKRTVWNTLGGFIDKNRSECAEKLTSGRGRGGVSWRGG